MVSAVEAHMEQHHVLANQPCRVNLLRAGIQLAEAKVAASCAAEVRGIPEPGADSRWCHDPPDSVGRFLMSSIPTSPYFTGKPMGGARADREYLTRRTGRQLMTSCFGGRPKLPRQQVRDQRVVTFLTAEERSRLDKIAGDARVSVSQACHDLVVKGMSQMDVSRQDTASTREKRKC